MTYDTAKEIRHVLAGTGIGKTDGFSEQAERIHIIAAYEERRKKSPCGTHTLGKEFASG